MSVVISYIRLCPCPLQNLLYCCVVAIKNSVTCKTRFIGKQDCSQKIRWIDALLNRPLTKLLPAYVIM
jgi:hypothetical protein